MPILRPLAAATGLAAVLIAAAGCNVVLDTLEDGSVSATPVTQIHLTGGSGDVTVQPDSTVTGVDVRRTVRYRGSKPGQTYHIDGDTLTLDTSCTGNCSVSYVVRIPPRGTGGVAVSGNNGSGDVKLSGIGSVDIRITSGNVDISDVAGPVSTRTGSGDTRVSDVSGDTSITTTSGNAEGHDLRGARTTVDVGSGDVTLDLPGTGDAVVRSTSGNIDVTVPDNTVAVSAETTSGDRNIDVRTNPTSGHTVELHAGSGDISVRPGAA